MTEAEARAALRAFVGGGDVEPWIAGRPWRAVPGGWAIRKPADTAAGRSPTCATATVQMLSAAAFGAGQNGTRTRS